MKSRIALRILAFNVLLIFIPLVAFSLLGSYERGLVDSLEHALAQQARITAAWLGAGSTKALPGDAWPGAAAPQAAPGSAKGAPAALDGRSARAALAAIGDRRTARFRVVDARGRLLADSSDVEAAAAGADAADQGASRAADSAGASGEPFLYRLFSSPSRLWRRFFAPPSPPFGSADFYAQSGDVLLGQEIKDALAGRYGAATRVSSGGQVSVTLYSAVPVYSGDRVVGAVLVSQSTYRILRELYAIRLDIAKIFALSLAAAAALSMLLALTIVGPVKKLSAAAASALGPSPRPGERAASAFPESSRGDEIGELQCSLRGLVSRLDDRALQTERFASDAAHEFRNPLASIRSAAELADLASSEEDRGRFHRAIIEDVDRLRAITEGLRRLSYAEGGSDSGERASVDVEAAARAACERARARCATERASPPAFAVEGAGGPAIAALESAALDVILDNLVGNAASFARGRVLVRLRGEPQAKGRAARILLEVEDDGPGIPEEHLSRVFDRFFTYRPGDEGGRHTGLGLSLALALARSQGGSLEAGNRSGGGARFTLALPADKR